MKQVILGVFVVVATALPFNTYAEETLLTQGFGMAKCSEYLKAVADEPDIDIYFFIWAQGYISGLNSGIYMADGPVRNVGARPWSELLDYLDNYCKENPTHKHVEGALKFYYALPVDENVAPLADALENYE